MITHSDLFDARFSSLDTELKVDILGAGTFKEVPAGTHLMKMGSQIHHTILIIDGRVKIYREGEDGGEMLMYFLEAGDACAISIMCAMSGETSQVSAVTESDCTFMSVPFEYVGKWMSKYRSWDQFIIQNYRKRFEELMISIDQIAFRSMDERLVYYLKRRQKIDGDHLHISHQEIARDVNSAREVVSRLLKKMEQRGAVKLERNQIHLLNLDSVL